jgi:hypothetical protein
MANAIQNAKLAWVAAVPDRPSARQTGRRRRFRAGASLSVFACMALNAAALAQAPAETITYSYDALGRLTNVAHTGNVNNGVNAAYTLDAAGNRSNVTVTTTAPPAAPSFAIGNASGTEGSTLTFTVTKTGTTSSTYTVNYATADGTAHAGTDYTTVSNALSFAPTDTSKTFTVSTINNSIVDGTRTFSVNLSGASGGASITTATGTGTINDDDTAPTPPSFSISGAETTEGGTLVFTVNKNGATTGTYTVNYASANGSATAGSDYNAVSGTLTFGPSVTSLPINVTTIDDTAVENQENMTVTLSGASGGAAITTATATGLIDDNDTAAPVTITLGSGSGVNLQSAATSQGYTPTSGVTYNFVVPSSATITGSAGGGTAISTGTWPAGAIVNLSIAGTVSGGGGNGGAGGPGLSPRNGSNGGAGGDGVSCSAPVTISVSGSLQGGGGGGGGAAGTSLSLEGAKNTGGGGGGGGAPNGGGGAGGTGAAGQNNGQAGFAGSTGVGGSGGLSGDSDDYGGDGGGPGMAGAPGGANTLNGGAGAAGYAVRKNGTTCTASGNITGTVG